MFLNLACSYSFCILGSEEPSFLSSEIGDIFVTELGIEATEGQLMNIGVFGDKQNFVIQFSEKEAFVKNQVRVIGQVISRSIFTIPGNTTMKGEFLVTRIRALL